MYKAASNSQFSSSRLNVLSLIDFCKGLAIVWVFFYHYSKTWFGWQGVHVFIVLSGFGLTYSCLQKNKQISWKQWYFRRAERILPVYWLVSLLGFLFLACINLRKSYIDIATDIINPTINLLSNLSIVRNLSYQTIFNYPNDQLWFVPLIFSLYMIFPLLYTLALRYRTVKGCLLLLIGTIIAEFVYRSISVYLLDGLPVGFQTPIWNGMQNLVLEPVDKIPNNFFFPFQGSAPFGLFPARIAEFMLGMFGAIYLVRDKHGFNRIFSTSTLVLGIVIWLIGYALVYIGLWGWAFASFFIALGLVIWTINLALFCQRSLSPLFIALSQVGVWSYYIFLTHSVVIHVFEFQVFINIEKRLLENNLFWFLLFKGCILIVMVFATAITSFLVMQFDKSKLPKLLMQRIFEKKYVQM